LVLVHWPGASKQEAASPANAELRRQTWRVLERYLRAGSFRAIGVSNYTVPHLEELLRYAEVPPACNQVECHPRYQQRELRDFCRQGGIAVQAYASLGCGELLREPAVEVAAAEAGVTPAQALLLWGLQRGLAVIPKSVQQQRLAEAAPGTLLSRQLSEAALQRLDALEELLGSCKYCWDPSSIV
jgi:diketogulonate reductase-like aldo/keto reductase